MARYWVDYRLRKTVSDPMADADLVGRINVNIFQEYLLDKEVEPMADLITGRTYARWVKFPRQLARLA